MNILCIILARGGSTRIPGKNIKILGGKPLIAYTIECAKHCTHQMRVVVSTDDPAIAAVAVKHGAEAPFLRPAAISQGDSLEIDAFKHALGWLKMFDQYEPDLIVKLFPTSPFRKPASVDKAIELLLADQDATFRDEVLGAPVQDVAGLREPFIPPHPVDDRQAERRPHARLPITPDRVRAERVHRRSPDIKRLAP